MPPLYSHLYRVVQDIQGNIVPDVMATVVLAGTSTLAVLYSDAEGLSALPNPVVNNAQYGSFSLYLDAGHYDMSFNRVGYVFEELRDIYVPEATGGVASLQGTPNQVLLSAATGDVVLSTPQNLDPDATLQFAHLGLGTPGEAGYGLVVQTSSTFRASMSCVGLLASGTVEAYAHLVNDRAGDNIVAFHSGLNAAGGANRWFLYGGGTAPAHLGGTLGVTGSVYFASTLTVASNASVQGSFTAAAITNNGPLYVAGVAGFGTAAVGGYSITTGYSSQFAANVTIGMLGTAASTTLDVNGSIRARSTLQVDSNATVAGSLTAVNIYASNSLTGLWIGAGGGVDTRFSLRSYGTSYFDGLVDIGSEAGHKLNVGGNVYITGVLGVGTAPDGGRSIAAGGSILTYSNFQANGTGYFGGQLTAGGNFNTNAISATSISCSSVGCSGHMTNGSMQAGLSGFGYAPVGGYWIRAGRSWVDDLSIGGSNGGWTLWNVGSMYTGGGVHCASTVVCAGRVDMSTDCQVLGALAVGNVAPAFEGYAFHCAPNAKFRAAIQCDGPASKPGGGPWADSNSHRRYKTNIRPLVGALGQLLALQGREWEWAEAYAALNDVLPGTRTGFVIEDVEAVRPQWVVAAPQEAPTGSKALAISGFEALTVEAFRELVQRLEALEGARHGGL